MARLRPLTPDSTITFLLKPLPIDTFPYCYRVILVLNIRAVVVVVNMYCQENLSCISGRWYDCAHSQFKWKQHQEIPSASTHLETFYFQVLPKLIQTTVSNIQGTFNQGKSEKIICLFDSQRKIIHYCAFAGTSTSQSKSLTFVS